MRFLQYQNKLFNHRMGSVKKNKIVILQVRTEQVHTNLLSLSLGKARKMTWERSQHKMGTWGRGIVSSGVSHGQGLKEHRGQHGPWHGDLCPNAQIRKRTLSGDQALHCGIYILFIKYLTYQSYIFIIIQNFIQNIQYLMVPQSRKRYNEQRDLIRTKKYTL